VAATPYAWSMRRHLKGLVFSILAAKLGRLLHRRGHSTAANYLQHELHRRTGGHGYGHGHGYGQGHYGYHGHYRPKKRRGRRRYW
jgi:hypothetical protein